ncbi:MAG: 3-hydroxyacyl-CoA dehydrogenase [Acidocella sp. 20-57-95]|nr:MAG: 3-hydroxyacyl-CoA dehydrogenase [Acidocella sp. 20-57-95]OYV59124.1 MAG: 3-hydroxyacyl-CoA dehydrogenase [Acidocella sp. 21-58-7]HQT65242.1 3-hydroxyacyl-CoA dehydrogenase [Acidocella sp.]HQU05604.1 3-hydroxyacyl-CoA dehydrogenase [Acidocella sp.]
MTKPSKRIAVIGAGLVGAGWAVVFARAGHKVKIFDASETLRRGLPAQLEASLQKLHQHGLITEAPEAVNARVTVVERMADAVSGADYVQESVFEQLDLKKSVSAEIAQYLAPHAVVGSSTSGFSGSSFMAALPNRSRFLVMHPVNPPHVIPVVEIVPTPWTAPEIAPQMREFMESIGQVPVVLNKEIDGFILNRLQGALLDEAWKLFEEGYASAADIDATISQGLGLRWSFMGPFETIDLNAPLGIDDYARRFGGMYQRLAALRHPVAPWPQEAIERATAECRATLPIEKLNERRAWRDDRLMALIAHKNQQG